MTLKEYIQTMEQHKANEVFAENLVEEIKSEQEVN